MQDLAAAHLAALERLESGTSIGPLNLGTGTGHSVQQVVDFTAALLQREVPYSITARRTGDPAILVADPATAVSLLNWRPLRSDLQTILEEALRSRY